MIKNPLVIKKYDEIVAYSVKDFGKWEQVKRIALLSKEWSIVDGELTPKLSLKRKVILEKNAATIEKIYADAEGYKG
jgi:long-chain acyl-CoA synthetase